MKTIILILFCLGSSLYAKDTKELCIEIAQGGAFNFYLEETCGFSRGVANKAVDAYKNLKCNKYIGNKQFSTLSEIAIDDGIQRFKAYGKSEFCDANMQGYNDVADIFDGIK